MYFKLKILYNIIILKISLLVFNNLIYSIQNKRWIKFKKHLIKSPFYSKYTFNNIPLDEFPIMNKSSFMRNFNEINTRKLDINKVMDIAIKAENTRDFSSNINDISVGLSSGTSGNRGIFLASENERALWVANILVRVIGISLRKRKVAFFLRANNNLYESVKSNLLEFNYFDLLDSFSSHVVRLKEVKPTIIVAQPSMLIQLAEEKLKGNLNINPKQIISVAEVLYDSDKIFIEKAFDLKISEVYQCTEGFLASTCSEGYLHFHEDFLVIEKKYIDSDKERFHPIITDLCRTTQPVIRYELNDIIHEKKDCKCNLNTMAIERIEGRSDDVLEFLDSNSSKVKIFPDFFRRSIILSDDSILDYSLTQVSDNLIELYLDNSDEIFSEVKNNLNTLLKKYNVINVEIIRVQDKNHELGNKFRRIKNENK